VTDLGLADGDWYEVLTAVERYEVPAQVVVVFTGAVDRHYIDQHMDILESGAYDVLAEPSQRAAVRAVIESAAAHSLRRFAAAAGRL
jgi:FixJ family two-component response regulator